MKTHLCNCILTFTGAPKGAAQAFLDLCVPLEAGDDVCRAFFEAIGDTIHRLPLLPGDETIPFACSPNAKAKRTVHLVKVSMCANADSWPAADETARLRALDWWEMAQGQLYWKENIT